jgi:hypothetical protein
LTSDPEFDKALGQYRFAVREILEPLNRYGQQVYCQMIEEHLLALAMTLHYKLSGIDMPYIVEKLTYPP